MSRRSQKRELVDVAVVILSICQIYIDLLFKIAEFLPLVISLLIKLWNLFSNCLQ